MTDTLPQLPTELLAEITRYAATEITRHVASKPSLCALARTSRTFNELAEPELYRNLFGTFRDVGWRDRAMI